MIEEYNNLYKTFQVKQKECQESRKKAAHIENCYNSGRVDLSSEIAKAHQALVKGKGDIRMVYQMQGSFKASLRELKKERAEMLKKIKAHQKLNSDCRQIDNQIKELTKENIDLKERLDDLKDHDISEKDFKKLQALNKKLKQEIAELKLMRDMLTMRQ
jgi:DNA repair exonuclease SbcCD ATPase subunit